MNENPRRRRADDRPVPVLAVEMNHKGGGAPDLSANETDEAHQLRVARLEATGWERAGDTWTKDTGDPRWARTEDRVVDGGSFFESTRAAWGIQVRNEAEDIRTEALRPRKW